VYCKLTDLHFDGVIFDLDGVVTLTASVHAAAWKKLFDGYLNKRAERDDEPFCPFDSRKDYLHYVDGKPRYEGVRSFLESRGIHLPQGTPSDGPDEETLCGLGNKKDVYFKQVLEEKDVEVDQATLTFIHELQGHGVRVGIASSSKNCLLILRRAGIEGLFEARVDGVVSESLGLKGKPNPDIFLKCAELLGVEPDKAIVVEDAVSGVQAGRNGRFGLVLGIDRGNISATLRENGADLVVEGLGETTVERIDAWFLNRAHRRPSALVHWDRLKQRFSGKRVAVFLDYDGTLTPIVSRPELAVLSVEMREVVGELASVCSTAIISGRGREDVAGMVKLDNVYYAGSHGFDITGPDGSHIQHEVDGSLQPLIDEVSVKLARQVQGIEGALIENKRFSLAVHYRMVAEVYVPRLEGIVDQVVKEHPKLRKAYGKKVFELRPNVDWDKGKALLWLLGALRLDGPEIIPLYIGDDTTDEDAFAAISNRGVGILVTDAPHPTAAGYSVQNTGEVGEFLNLLTRYIKERQ